MVKLQHQTRRDGGINVRGTWHMLDASGYVYVSEEHAALMLQGAKWRKVFEEHVPPRPLQDSSVLSEEPEDKAELLERAKSMGLNVDGRTSRLRLASMIRRAGKEI